MPGELLFKPIFVQKGRGPHLFDFALTMDGNGDVFYSDISVMEKGIRITNSFGTRKFAVSVRWNVEGYGYLFLTLDNGGALYELPATGVVTLNLNYELARSWVARNQRRFQMFSSAGWIPSHEVTKGLETAGEYLGDASRLVQNPQKCADYSQTALRYAILASEQMEIEKARFDIIRNGHRPDFLMGCDARGYFQMNKEIFLERFSELFNYATITHYLKGDFVDFEPVEGQKQFRERDEVLDRLLNLGITIEGRPLYWTHSWVTPDWLRGKSYPELLKYLESHVRQVVGHYKDKINVWEVVNELHDWAMEIELNHEQTIELTRHVCQVARDTNPRIQLLVNNCCPFAEYIQKRKWHERDAKYPQRTPHQFTRELIDAGVDFDIVGVQVYFVHRTLTDALQSIERYESMGKRIQLAEIGAPSRGITQEFTEEVADPSTRPYEWRRHWDEELQADWLENTFTFAYSKPYIEAANWYDFVDPFGFLKSGGILRSPAGEKKAAVDRLISLKKQWNKLGSV